MPPNPDAAALHLHYATVAAKANQVLGTLDPELRLLIAVTVGRRLAIARGLIAA